MQVISVDISRMPDAANRASVSILVDDRRTDKRDITVSGLYFEEALELLSMIVRGKEL